MSYKTLLKNFIFILTFCSMQACGQSNKEKEKLIKDAVNLFNSKKYDQALNSFDKLINLDSTDYISWVFRGRTLHLLKNDNDAFKSLDKAIKLNPDYSDAYGYRGTLYSFNGNPELALLDLEKALDANHNDTALLLIRAGVFQKLKQYENSITDCNRLLSFKPSNSEVLFYRATANKRLGKIDEALNDYNQSLKANPENSEAYNDRAFIFLGQNKFDLAIADYSKAIQFARAEYEQAKAFAFNNRGFALYKVGDISAGLKDINYSLELLPDNSYAYKNRALLYLKLKETNNACSDLAKAISLGFTEKYGDEVLKLQNKNCK